MVSLYSCPDHRMQPAYRTNSEKWIFHWNEKLSSPLTDRQTAPISRDEHRNEISLTDWWWAWKPVDDLNFWMMQWLVLVLHWAAGVLKRISAARNISTNIIIQNFTWCALIQWLPPRRRGRHCWSPVHWVCYIFSQIVGGIKRKDWIQAGYNSMQWSDRILSAHVRCLILNTFPLLLVYALRFISVAIPAFLISGINLVGLLLTVMVSSPG